VDIERKFTELTQKNLENVEKVFEKSSFKPKLGKAVVITGDARHLSTLLQQHADAIVTSPPYSQSVGHQGGLDKSDFKHGCRYRERYPKSKRNIGNLKHNKTVDTILTSPPYADIHQCPTNTGLTEFFRKQLEEKSYIEWNGKRYTEAEWRAMNHGRIDGRSTPGVKKDAKYSENPQNIGNLPHTENVDIILTSPPYASSLKKHNEKTEETVKQKLGDAYLTPGRLAAQKRMQGGYTEITQKNNIGNLPHTEDVDVILTSPPYQNALHDSMQKRETWKSKKIHDDKKGLPIGYSENRNNIGNIKEHGEVDAILTSPPFGESLSNKSGGMKGERNLPNRALSAKGDPQQYSTNPENIGNLTYTNEGLDETIERLREHGNLPKGTVDTILTSPPYGHEATASKPTKLEMKGLFKMGHSKETPLTDEDYRTWEMRSKGNIAKRKLFVRVPCKPEEAQFHDTRKGRKGTIWEWTKEVKVDLNNINVQEQKSQEKGKTETYLEAMYKVYNECYQVLKPPVDWCSCDDE
jgi:tRNA G10  N-methylase Trm11